MDLLTLAEAVSIMGVTRQTAMKHLKTGYLKGRRFGRFWFVAMKDAARFKSPPPGNPKFRKRQKPR